MDLHPPGGPVRSLKDFFIHIGVVTLGILIALGLEQLVESHHRAHLAEVAVAGFRRELAFNEDQVRDVLARIPEKQAKVDAAIAMLSTAPAAGSAPNRLPIPAFPWTWYLLRAGTRQSRHRHSPSCRLMP